MTVRLRWTDGGNAAAATLGDETAAAEITKDGKGSAVRFLSGPYKLVACVLAFVPLGAVRAEPPSPEFGRPVPPLVPNKSKGAEPALLKNLRIEPPPVEAAEVRPITPSKPIFVETRSAEPLPDQLPVKPLPGRLAAPKPALEIESQKSAAVAAPAVTVELVGPESAGVGQMIRYEIVLRNNGASTAHNVVVRQELAERLQFVGAEPAPEQEARRLHWRLEHLAAGAEKRLQVRVKALDDGEFRTEAAVSFSVTSQCTTRVSRPKLILKMTAPETAVVGDEVPFRIQISNGSAVRIASVALRDRLPAGLSHPQGREIEAEVGPLDPGETRTIVLRTTATRSGTFANEIHAVAHVSQAPGGVELAGGPNATALEASAKAAVLVGEPGLSVKQAGPKECAFRTEALFTVEVTNNGTAMTKNVRVVDRLPANLEFVAASDDGRYDPRNRTITWALGALDFGTQRTMTVKARAAAMGEGSNLVQAQADNDLSARSELPLRVTGTPGLSLEILDLNNPAPVGKDATYEIRVFNQGGTPCSNLQISVTLPEGMILRDAEAPAPYKLEDNQVAFAPYPKLGTRADLVYRLKVQCKTPGDAKIHVQLTCDQLQRPVIKEEISRFFQP